MSSLVASSRTWCWPPKREGDLLEGPMERASEASGIGSRPQGGGELQDAPPRVGGMEGWGDRGTEGQALATGSFLSLVPLLTI